jgi:UDP:flavonoid glycosyltransferase YjiC (YdhE family)
MRVLFSCVPGYGHFHPMVPLARALVQAGHPVAFATAERFCRRVVEPAGFPAFAAGLSPHVVHERTLDLVSPEEIPEDELWRFGALMFAGVAAPAKVDPLVDALRTWRADLVVHDATDFAGPLAAATGGIPWVSHGFGALEPVPFWAAAADAVAPTWQARGLEPGPFGGVFRSLYLDICPTGLQSPMIEQVAVAQRLRPVTFDNPGDEGPPAWLHRAPPPVVYVTLGTVDNHAPGVFETVVPGLAGTAGTVVVTIGPDRDPAELGPLPAHVHVEGYLPQSLVFPSCDLVVCHGGSGTVLAALACGLPLVTLPQGANQFWNADRLAAVGAGERLRPDELTAAAVGDVAARVLGDRSYRDAAQEIQEEIAGMPGTEDIVTLLEERFGKSR